ncbi:hypothetical protein ASE12_14225 [Aeromicrobium sp. Root236]|uniref:GntR family transcriptional regulator n=1 Tax=Aeromicrobium sp. Root236 TaxID=1736498 RepID=UPI0006FE0166|nr:GntR family transcriptional regulator [Aeromicrobium sp. Root236]KRC65812.1 hypothetical protein ASE12_14225 [Aeromicrobium sp. Root236]
MSALNAQAELLARLADVPLTRSGATALHWQCGETLRQLIQELHYPPGVPLPPENDMAKALGVSRPTLRQAMKRLSAEGVVHSQRGVGAFALRTGITRGVGLSSLHRDLLSSGRSPSTKVLLIETLAAQSPITEELNLEPGRKLFHVKRVRYADGQPLVMIYTYLALPDDAHLTREQLEKDGLYNLLHQVCGVELVGGQQRVSVRQATASEATHLGIEAAAPVMVAHRVAFDTQGRGVEYAHIVYPEGVELQSDLRGTSLRAGTLLA